MSEQVPGPPGRAGRHRVQDRLLRWPPRTITAFVILILLAGVSIGTGVVLMARKGDRSVALAISSTPTLPSFSPSPSESPAPKPERKKRPTSTAQPVPTEQSTLKPSGQSTSATLVPPIATNPPARTPLIVKFTADPNPVPCSGDPKEITLSWAALYTVEFYLKGPGVSGSYGLSTSTTVMYPCDGQSHSYTLTAEGAYGITTKKTITVSWTQGPSP